MTLLSFLLLLPFTIPSGGFVEDVDLSQLKQSFPTSSVSVQLCNSAYDSLAPPPTCLPFLISLQIKGLRNARSHNERSALVVDVRNEGSQPIDLPRSPVSLSKGASATFISLEIYSASEPKIVLGVAFAFADSKVSSSEMRVNPREFVRYDLPLEMPASKKSTDEALPVLVKLTAYSIERDDDNVGLVSKQRGNAILSRPFELR